MKPPRPEDNAKKEQQVKALLAAKVEHSRKESIRKKTVQRLHTLSMQADNQQAMLAQVKEDMQALGADVARIDQVIAVLKKVEIVLAQESVKL